MTPFGLWFESIRRSRQLQQVQVASMLGINSCYVSAFENGNKSPPSIIILEKMISVLDLNVSEQEALWIKAEQSKKTYSIPINCIPEEYVMMNDLSKHLGSLSGEQIAIISNVLKIGAGLSKSSSTIQITSGS